MHVERVRIVKPEGEKGQEELGMYKYLVERYREDGARLF